jgi:hypothetical protein
MLFFFLEYGKFASHEVNFFIYKKSPELFQKILIPYLRNKKEKQLIDWYLLGSDNILLWQKYSRADVFKNLNAIEQIFVVHRLKELNKILKDEEIELFINGFLKKIKQHVMTEIVDREKETRLFEIALKSGLKKKKKEEKIQVEEDKDEENEEELDNGIPKVDGDEELFEAENYDFCEEEECEDDCCCECACKPIEECCYSRAPESRERRNKFMMNALCDMPEEPKFKQVGLLRVCVSDVVFDIVCDDICVFILGIGLLNIVRFFFFNLNYLEYIYFS